eukprot:TRINITY_DN7702_c0_g1_i3.p1 TRINITY_DN7702_c0_g1~~TRINITY_DN7702_c0_g1_i3.p1  ORF type:complete len:551 (-),score=173.27 TRINITY_DN7702_c0_g1_i3:178-1830(-)
MSHREICTSGDEFIRLLKDCGPGNTERLRLSPLVTDLELYGVIPLDLKEEALIVLERFLRTNSVLLTLNISANKINAKDLEPLCSALNENTSLTQLTVYGNKIGDQGAEAIAKTLESNSILQELNIGNNEIGDQGAGHIARALEKNNKLNLLDLRGNFIGDKGAGQIAASLTKNKSLTQLDFGVNMLSSEGAKKFAEVLENNRSASLINLFLYGNKITDDGFKALQLSLQTNSRLRKLLLDDNKSKLSHEQRKDIEACLSRNAEEALRAYDEEIFVPEFCDGDEPREPNSDPNSESNFNFNFNFPSKFNTYSSDSNSHVDETRKIPEDGQYEDPQHDEDSHSSGRNNPLQTNRWQKDDVTSNQTSGDGGGADDGGGGGGGGDGNGDGGSNSTQDKNQDQRGGDVNNGDNLNWAAIANFYNSRATGLTRQEHAQWLFRLDRFYADTNAQFQYKQQLLEQSELQNQENQRAIENLKFQVEQQKEELVKMKEKENELCEFKSDMMSELKEQKEKQGHLNNLVKVQEEQLQESKKQIEPHDPLANFWKGSFFFV